MAMSKASGRGRGRWARSGRALEEQQVLSALSHLSLLLTWALKNIDIDGKFVFIMGGSFLYVMVNNLIIALVPFINMYNTISC